MSTLTEVEEPISQSDMTKVYDVPFSNLYRIEAHDLMGRKEEFETRAYTKHLIVNADSGHIAIEIGAKGHDIPTPTIPYPYHMLKNGVLFAFKRNRFNEGNEFALNYDLFSLNIKLVVILHYQNGKGELFISSIDEWRKSGRLGHTNRELQIYLGVDENRVLPLEYGRLLFQDVKTRCWFNACSSVQYGKSHR